MKTVKVSELTGSALDWVVARTMPDGAWWRSDEFLCSFQPSTDWADGGPIIEKMKSYCQEKDEETGECYCATPSVAEDWHDHPVKARGTTPLIAAMRCYVASKLGDTVEVPEELL